MRSTRPEYIHLALAVLYNLQFEAMPDSSQKSQIGVWLDDELRSRVEAAAAREGRSLSGFVRNLLQRQIEVEERLYDSAPTVPMHQS